MLRILMVSWYFPPANTIGAVRVGKLAKYLHGQGHSLRVLTAADIGQQNTLRLEIPPELVIATPWRDVQAPVDAAARLWARRPERAKKTDAAPVASLEQRAAPTPGIARKLMDFSLTLVKIPDHAVGWLPSALMAARRLLELWRPDIILVSGPPFTALVIGRVLGGMTGIPVVAELRDRWEDDPYFPPPPWRRAIDRVLERWCLSKAAGIITVSEPWAQGYRAKYGVPVASAMNGFDPDDYPTEPLAPPPGDDPRTLRIVYTGSIYFGYRDPTPLFRAIAAMGADADRVRVEFYGTDPNHVLPYAAACGVERHVVVHPKVGYAQSIAIQRQADVLLAMQWNDPRDNGHLPAKLFEYFGARRPILNLGHPDGLPSMLVRTRSAGVAENEPKAIAAALRQWLAEKEQNGAIAPCPLEARAGLSRPEQFACVESFLLALTQPQPSLAAASDSVTISPPTSPVK